MHFTLATNGQFGGAQRQLKVAESRTLIYRFWPIPGTDAYENCTTERAN
jgi:hypothetical protein